MKKSSSSIKLAFPLKPAIKSHYTNYKDAKTTQFVILLF